MHGIMQIAISYLIIQYRMLFWLIK